MNERQKEIIREEINRRLDALLKTESAELKNNVFPAWLVAMRIWDIVIEAQRYLTLSVSIKNGDITKMTIQDEKINPVFQEDEYARLIEKIIKSGDQERSKSDDF